MQILLDHKYRHYISSDFSFTQNQELGYMTHFFFYQNVVRKYYEKFFLPNQKFSKLIKKMDTKIFTNYYFKTERLEKDLKIFLKKNKIRLKQFKDFDKNSTKMNLDKNCNKNYGYGFRLKEHDKYGKIVYHTGWWKGFRSYFIKVMDKNQTIVVLNNVKRGRFLNIDKLIEVIN